MTMSNCSSKTICLLDSWLRLAFCFSQKLSVVSECVSGLPFLFPKTARPCYHGCLAFCFSKTRTSLFMAVSGLLLLQNPGQPDVWLRLLAGVFSKTPNRNTPCVLFSERYRAWRDACLPASGSKAHSQSSMCAPRSWVAREMVCCFLYACACAPKDERKCSCGYGCGWLCLSRNYIPSQICASDLLVL